MQEGQNFTVRLDKELHGRLARLVNVITPETSMQSIVREGIKMVVEKYEKFYEVELKK